MPKAQSTLQDTSDFTWPEEHRPTIKHNDYQLDQDLPVIDLAGLQDETHESRLKVAKEIVAACSEWGFFHLINHGIPVEELDEVQEQASCFFELPLDLKQRTSISEDGAPICMAMASKEAQLTNLQVALGMKAFGVLGHPACHPILASMPNGH